MKKKMKIDSKSANCAEMGANCAEMGVNCAEMGVNCAEMIISSQLAPISAPKVTFFFSFD